MKFSTRSEYGLRALTILSESYGQGPVPLRVVAEREQISEHYLEQIFSDLRKADLITSIRGANGGYVLARHPDKLSLLELITALEGEIAPCDCVRADGAEACLRDTPCLVQPVWYRLRDGMNEILNGISLQDVCQGKI